MLSHSISLLQGFGLLSFIILIVDIILNSKELKTDFYVQGPSPQSKSINENMTISTIYKEHIDYDSPKH